MREASRRCSPSTSRCCTRSGSTSAPLTPCLTMVAWPTLSYRRLRSISPRSWPLALSGAREIQRGGDPRDLNQIRTDLAVDRLLGNDQTAPPAPRSAAPPHRHRPSHTPTPARTAATSEFPERAPPFADETNAKGRHGAGAGTPTRGCDFVETFRWDFRRPIAVSPSRPTASEGATADPNADRAQSPRPPGTAGVGAEPGRWGAGGHPLHLCRSPTHWRPGRSPLGGELEGYGPLPQDALAIAFTRAQVPIPTNRPHPRLRSPPGTHRARDWISTSATGTRPAVSPAAMPESSPATSTTESRSPTVRPTRTTSSRSAGTTTG